MPLEETMTNDEQLKEIVAKGCHNCGAPFPALKHIGMGDWCSVKLRVDGYLYCDACNSTLPPVPPSERKF
jgi:hypothetical protein